jgi:hypothetical protein
LLGQRQLAHARQHAAELQQAVDSIEDSHVRKPDLLRV